MIRVPSTGSLAVVKSKSTGDLRSVCNISEATSMLTATATIVTAASSIADSSHSTVALIGAVASMIGASASILGTVAAPKREIVEVSSLKSPSRKGALLIDGVPALEARQRRRLDLKVSAAHFVAEFGAAPGYCAWDGPGPDGVFVNSLPLEAFLESAGADALSLAFV